MGSQLPEQLKVPVLGMPVGSGPRLAILVPAGES